MITSILEYKRHTKRQKNSGTDLILVDIQPEFKEFFGDEYVEKVKEYCHDFNRVFQIWDSTKATKPEYEFPNQVMTYEKKYGGELTENLVEGMFTETIWQVVKNKLKNIPTKGDLFENIYGESWCFVSGKMDNLESNVGHDWFLVSRELMNLFKLFKEQERKIILCGGAQNECILDIYTVLKTMNINVEYNMGFVYSNKGSQFQKI